MCHGNMTLKMCNPGELTWHMLQRKLHKLTWLSWWTGDTSPLISWTFFAKSCRRCQECWVMRVNAMNFSHPTQLCSGLVSYHNVSFSNIFQRGWGGKSRQHLWISFGRFLPVSDLFSLPLFLSSCRNGDLIQWCKETGRIFTCLFQDYFSHI